MVLHSLLLAAVSAAPPPSAVHLTGSQDQAGVERTTLTFTDGEGQHEVVFGFSSRAQRRSRTLDVSHRVRAAKDAVWTHLWTAKDFVKDCEFDLTLALVPGSITVTDLNGDGRAEVAFLYVADCRSDVSPETLKLLLYDGRTKYALRGTTRERVGTDQTGEPKFEGGDFTADKAFDGAPKEFLAHAQQLWAAHRAGHQSGL